MTDRVKQRKILELAEEQGQWRKAQREEAEGSRDRLELHNVVEHWLYPRPLIILVGSRPR